MQNKLVKDYIDRMAKEYGFSYQEITGRDRKKELSDVRTLIARLLRKDWAMSYSAIGEHLGKRNHATIMSMIRQKDKRYFKPKL